MVKYDVEISVTTNMCDKEPGYHDQPTIDHSSDPLQYFEANINVFPNSSKLVLQYLTVYLHHLLQPRDYLVCQTRYFHRRDAN